MQIVLCDLYGVYICVYISHTLKKKRLWKCGLSLFLLIIFHSCEIMSAHN